MPMAWCFDSGSRKVAGGLSIAVGSVGHAAPPDAPDAGTARDRRPEGAGTRTGRTPGDPNDRWSGTVETHTEGA